MIPVQSKIGEDTLRTIVELVRKKTAHFQSTSKTISSISVRAKR